MSVDSKKEHGKIEKVEMYMNTRKIMLYIFSCKPMCQGTGLQDNSGGNSMHCGIKV